MVDLVGLLVVVDFGGGGGVFLGLLVGVLVLCPQLHNNTPRSKKNRVILYIVIRVFAFKTLV